MVAPLIFSIFFSFFGGAWAVTCFKTQTSSMEEGDPVTKITWLKKECVWLAVGMIEVCKAIVDIMQSEDWLGIFVMDKVSGATSK